ncbi:MAG: hypothetical protein ACHQ51_02830 [Elusimicrobiota bacterium]
MNRAALFAVIVALCAGAARAGEIVVVAPESPMAPYQEALQGVCDALGACPPVLNASGNFSLPKDARVVIALGGRAARLRYPPRAIVVTALTPGYDARPGPGGAVVHVRLTFSPAAFTRKLAALRPGVRRAVLLWAEPSSGRYASAARAAAAAAGWEALPVQVPDARDLPSLLRSLPAADAVWLAPDPGLVTPSTFDAAREYARSLGAAFFAPAPGLADRGADPGLAPAFRAAGLRAGEIARAALAGPPEDDEAYPDDGPAELKFLLVSTRTVQPR